MSTKLEQLNKLREQMMSLETEALNELVQRRKDLQGELKDVEKTIAGITGKKASTGVKGGGKRVDSEETILAVLKTVGKDGLTQNEIEGRQEMSTLYGGNVPKQYGKLSSMVEAKKLTKKGPKYIIKG